MMLFFIYMLYIFNKGEISVKNMRCFINCHHLLLSSLLSTAVSTRSLLKTKVDLKVELVDIPTLGVTVNVIIISVRVRVVAHVKFVAIIWIRVNPVLCGTVVSCNNSD